MTPSSTLPSPPLDAAPRRSITRRWPALPWAAILILGFFIVMAVFAGWIAPHNPERAALASRYLPPFWVNGGSLNHLLGTDHLGRDLFSQLLYGARISLTVGITAVLFAGVIGTAVGIASGFLGGWVDQIVMRLVDAWLALPSLVFAIFLAALLGPSETNLVIILAAVYWTRYARVVRSEVLSLRERDFVKLATVAGASRLRIMLRHLLPNVTNTAVVLATLMLGSVIITEASLSFLGVGVPPPKPAWGLILADGRKSLMAGYWWLTVFPGLCIMLVVLSVSLLGDWLRDKLDPQLKPLS